MKRYAMKIVHADRTLYVYAANSVEAVIKAGRAGYTVGAAYPAGSYDPLLNIICERAHVNGKANGHANGHQLNGGHR